MNKALRVLVLILTVLIPAPRWALADDDLGRLFTTASERKALDELRRNAPDLAPTPVAATETRSAATVVAESNALTLRGVVHRGSGRSTAWINDSNTYQGDIGAAHGVVDRGGIAGNQAVVRVPGTDSTIRMKVGQTLDPASAQVSDLGVDRTPSARAAPPSEEDDDE